MTMPVNGKLKQVRHPSAGTVPWIGWTVIGVMWTLIMFGGSAWIKNIEAGIKEKELAIKDVERQIQQLLLAQQTEKARLDSKWRARWESRLSARRKGDGSYG